MLAFIRRALSSWVVILLLGLLVVAFVVTGIGDPLGGGGPAAGSLAKVGKANITVNKNSVPHDPQKPFITSGIRIGSPAMTTRGMRELEAELLANLICDVLEAWQDEGVIARVAGEVKRLCAKFPVYG